MEIERKFLVLNAELITQLTKWGYAEDISQYYIQVGEFEERYRRKGDKCFHTIKKKVDDMQREEIEVEVSNECFEFNKRNRLEDSIILQKKRYVMDFKGDPSQPETMSKHYYEMEVDVYENEYKGLVIAEIEFKTIEEANSFIPPSWLVDITDDEKYKNQTLALNSCSAPCKDTSIEDFTCVNNNEY